MLRTEDLNATIAGLTDVKDGAINADFECNPLAAPYVEDIIKKLKDGSQPESKKIYVDESCFACDDTVTTFKTDEDKEITMTARILIFIILTAQSRLKS